MKKIVLFSGPQPDAIANFIREHNINRYSQELVDFVESAPIISRGDFHDRFPQLIKSGELVCIDDIFEIQGYCDAIGNFTNVSVVEYDATHRHIIDSYDGEEFLVDLDDLECVDEECNIYKFPQKE